MSWRNISEDFWENGDALGIPPDCAADMAGFHVEPGLFLKPENGLNLLFPGASALCFVTWNHAVKTLGAVKTSVCIYMVPVITAVFSALILKEPITAATGPGILLTLCGPGLSESGKK